MITGHILKTNLVNFTTDKFTANYNLVIYKSTDKGQMWQQIGYTNWPSTVGYWAKDGNNIYIYICHIMILHMQIVEHFM